MQEGENRAAETSHPSGSVQEIQCHSWWICPFVVSHGHIFFPAYAASNWFKRWGTPRRPEGEKPYTHPFATIKPQRGKRAAPQLLLQSQGLAQAPHPSALPLQGKRSEGAVYQWIIPTSVLPPCYQTLSLAA
ncbi:unnamed protein product [Lepidochelys olivacea]